MITRRRTIGAAASMLALATAGCAQPSEETESVDDLFRDNAEGETDVGTRAFDDWTPYWSDLPTAEREREVPVVPTDADSVDFAQFPEGAARLSGSVDVDAAAFRKALAWSSMNPAGLGSKVLFGLRGAELLNADEFANGASFQRVMTLGDARPDHVNLRCVIGVWDTSNDTFWATQASTVPHVIYLYAQRKAVDGVAGTNREIDKFSNVLATGVYNYRVGTHRNGAKTRQPGAFKLNDRVAVVRNLDQGAMSVTRKDTWEYASSSIGDNIHAAMANDKVGFWSAGCQVIPGGYSSDRRRPHGAWREFRIAAGLRADPEIIVRNPEAPRCFDTSEDNRFSCAAPGEREPPAGGTGATYNYVLLTGAEVRLAANNVSIAANDQQFARMRRGSSGPRVRALRTALGMSDGDAFDAAVQRRYIEHFQTLSGFGADGVVTPDEAARLSLNGLIWT